MAEATPLKFDFDDATPSAVSEFTVSDVTPVINGGTGVSSLTEFGKSLSGTSISSTTVSANTITTAASSITVSACPIPQPFGYVQTDTAGTNSTDEQNFGLGADITSILSDSDHFTWDDTNKQFNVSAAGTYELLANLVIDAGSQNDILTIKSKRNGSAVVTISPRLYGNVGPVERTFHCALTATASDILTVSIEMGGSKTVHLEAGSTLTIKRLK